MHAHLERRHRRPCPPRDFVVRQPFYVLQHEYLALLRREVHERPLQWPHPLRLFERPIGPIRGRPSVVSLVARSALPLAAPLLPVKTITQAQLPSPPTLVRPTALRQAPERAHQSV